MDIQVHTLKRNELTQILKELKKKLKIIDPENKVKEAGNWIVCAKVCTKYFGYLPCCTTDDKPNVLCNKCADQTMQIDDEIPSVCPNCNTVIGSCFGRIYFKIEDE